MVLCHFTNTSVRVAASVRGDPEVLGPVGGHLPALRRAGAPVAVGARHPVQGNGLVHHRLRAEGQGRDDATPSSSPASESDGLLDRSSTTGSSDGASGIDDVVDRPTVGTAGERRHERPVSRRQRRRRQRPTEASGSDRRQARDEGLVRDVATCAGAAGDDAAPSPAGTP